MVEIKRSLFARNEKIFFFSFSHKVFLVDEVLFRDNWKCISWLSIVMGNNFPVFNM